MYKLLVILFSLCASTSSFAQNIVVNPGFETYSQCPTNTSQLNKATGWETPNYGTPDYYNVCNTVNAGVPSNSFGSQNAATGNGYAGIIPYLIPLGNYVEYMEGHLTNMQPGQYYRVAMKVSFSEFNAYAIAGLGVFFTVDSLYAPTISAGPLLHTPQIDYTSYGVIVDTANWLTLVDTFFADSAYKFLTIGCFKSPGLIEVDTVNYTSQPGAYYYIDDVVVEPITVGIACMETNGVAIGIYPHPLVGSSEVRFNNPERDAYYFSMFNMQGQLVNRITDIRSDKFIISKGDLPSGIYYYQLGSNATRYAGKLMVN